MVLLTGGPLGQPGVPWLVAKGKQSAAHWLESNGYVRQPGKRGDRYHVWLKQLEHCVVWCQVEPIASVESMPIDILK